MFVETAYINLKDGLSGPQEDCLARITGYSSDYVFAGSRLQYTGTATPPALRVPLSQVFRDYQTRIQTNVIGRGYRDVSVSVEGSFIGDEARITVSFVSPIDHGSKEDARSNVDGAISQSGLKVLASAITQQRPSPQEICSGSAAGGAQGTQGQGAGGSPRKEPDWLEKLGETLGIGTAGALIGGAIVLIIFLKR